MTQRRTASGLLLLAVLVLTGIAFVLVRRGPRTRADAIAPLDGPSAPVAAGALARPIELAAPRRASEPPREPALATDAPAAADPAETEPRAIARAAVDASRAEVYVLLTTEHGALVVGAACTFVSVGEDGARLAPGCCPSFAFTSDEAGYVSASLEPGRWIVEARADGLVGFPRDIDVAAGDALEVPITMAPTVEIAGRVLDARTRTPIAGALVWSPLIGTGGAVRSGSDGSYRLTHAPSDGSYRVCARASGYGTTVAPTWARNDIARRLDIELVRGHTLRGRLAAGVVDARIAVSGLYVSTSGGSPDDDATRPGADGAFAFEDLRSDVRHTLTVDAPGYARFVTQVPGTVGTVDLGTLVLEPEAILSGRVLTSSGTPASGVHVQLEPAGYADGAWRHTCTADDAGRYRLDALGAGRWNAVVTGFRDELARFAVDLVPGTTQRDVELTDTSPAMRGRIEPVPARADELRLRVVEGNRERGTLPIAPDGTFRAYDMRVSDQAQLVVERLDDDERTWLRLGASSCAGLAHGREIVVALD